MINYSNSKIEKIEESFLKIYNSKAFIWLTILLGIFIRFRQYLFNRSLWLDEAFLALNILKLNYIELLTPLLHGQAAPPFFLLLTKLFTEIAGYSEYVLRFLPFICGAISLILFYPLASYFLHKKVIPIAVGLLSFSYYAIYYSAEFKQYSVDLLITVLLILFAFKLNESKYTRRHLMYFGGLAILSNWFSHASVFVLAGVGLALLYKILFENEKFDKNKIKISHLRELIAIGILSITSFALHYFLIIRPVPKGHFYEFWAKGFMPFPPLGFSEIKWYLSNGINILKHPLGFNYLYGIAFIFVIIGIGNFWKRKEKLYFNLLILPIIILMIASALHIYPINGRLILFILPIIYLFISEGIFQFIKYFYPHKRIVALSIVIFLLLYPVFNGMSYLIRPILREEIKPIIQYCLENKKEDDKIYVYYGAKTAFEYYTWSRELDILPSVDNNRENPEEYIKDLEETKGQGRVWFIFSHMVKDEETLYLTYLGHIAQKLDSFESKGAGAYLYNL